MDQPQNKEKRVSVQTVHVPSKFFGVEEGTETNLSNVDSKTGPKQYFESLTVEDKNREAVHVLASYIEKQKVIAEDIAKNERIVNVSNQYKTIESIITSPICCGYLLQFCKVEFNAENLTFILEVDEYRDIFDTETQTIWTKSWIDIDEMVKIDDEEISNELMKVVWPSENNKEQIEKKIERIFKKFLDNDSPVQVCISENFMKKTRKRMKLLQFYGPDVFSEACLDPIKTLKKDVLPRFLVSEIAQNMFSMLASCYNLPSANQVRVIPPSNSFIAELPLVAMPEDRQYTLEECLQCELLYNSLIKYVTSNESLSYLYFARMHYMFIEFIEAGKENEAKDQAWLMYKYFIAPNSPFEFTEEMITAKYYRSMSDGQSTKIVANKITREISDYHIQCKRLSLQLAKPNSDTFDYFKKLYHEILMKSFDAYEQTPEYAELGKLMLAEKKKIEHSVEG